MLIVLGDEANTRLFLAACKWKQELHESIFLISIHRVLAGLRTTSGDLSIMAQFQARSFSSGRYRLLEAAF